LEEDVRGEKFDAQVFGIPRLKIETWGTRHLIK
jgi:hypothetical protein